MTAITNHPVLPAVEPPSWWERQTDVIMRRPLNEWTFTHINWLVPTASVARAPRPRPLVSRPEPLDLSYRFDGRDHTLAELHRRTYTTAFVVLHRGQIVHEAYPGAFASSRTRMQTFSVSKSITSLLVGIALADGAIGSVKDQVVDYRPDFRGTAYDGVTLADLLDMSSGVGDQEVWDIDSPIRRFERAVLNGGDVVEIVKAARRTSEPGERFNYSTFDNQLLGWVLEVATGQPLASYCSDRLWGPIGAERDAYYALTRSHPRTAVGSGAFNATARDLARVGKLMVDDGMVGGERIVPAEWVRRSRGTELPHLAVGALGDAEPGHYGYANQWWTLGESCFHAFTALGVHGQFLFVDPAADVVVVKCSAWPTEEDHARDRETITAMRRIADHFA
jgi:CubicO group peptidase (beta-lactamase class C family)